MRYGHTGFSPEPRGTRHATILGEVSRNREVFKASLDRCVLALERTITAPAVVVQTVEIEAISFRVARQIVCQGVYQSAAWLVKHKKGKKSRHWVEIGVEMGLWLEWINLPRQPEPSVEA